LGKGNEGMKLGPWDKTLWETAVALRNLMRPIVGVLKKYEAVDACISTVIPDLIDLVEIYRVEKSRDDLGVAEYFHQRVLKLLNQKLNGRLMVSGFFLDPRFKKKYSNGETIVDVYPDAGAGGGPYDRYENINVCFEELYC
jgi:hypothetical protein